MLDCNPEKQMPVTSANLGDESFGAWDHRCYPAFVAHEAVDAAEIAAGKSCAGVIMREVIEKFRGEFTHDYRDASIDPVVWVKFCPSCRTALEDIHTADESKFLVVRYSTLGLASPVTEKS